MSRLFPQAERAAAHLPPLLLAAQRVAAAVTQGSHGRRRPGPGETFWQFRPYSPGDSLRSIDWRQTGKSERTQVRDREWMAAQTVGLWADGRASMGWRSRPDLPEKGERAAILALALAILLAGGGERLGLLDLTPDGAVWRLAVGPWSHGQHAATRLAEQMALQTPGAPLDSLPAAATAVLFSDALDPPEQTAALLRSLSQRGARGHLVQLLDPAEETFPFQGRMLFTTAQETTPAGGQEPWLVPRAEDIRAAYQERLAAHRLALHQITQNLGWSLTLHHTDQPPQTALLALYHRLNGAPTPFGGR